ncbi:carboxypeptidase M32 [Celerinatantimonas diazotrophica]|uniref:Metal-dependent carboxypeptidase n=1 Tax=Celerinatantimonas diazotrophica TaxID=412034 RepID=A0A4R1K392_9GAMM|nr:carboxypeptidase M32 [Celerinatantimonas diazotrophica]TCK58544.1 carboxypeptidase Taq [Celerinatantimonas diazotrophica]CAG9297173.1 Carboxypeptidase 1 [Celerinatantimonas diazotrophica]
MATSFYQKLTEHFKSIYHLQHLQAIVGWDQATQMPAGGNEARSNALSELAITIHQAYKLSALDEWFDCAAEESLDIPQQQSLTEMRHQWQQATMLPAELVRAKSIAGNRCEHAWREQRRNNNWEGFKPLLKEVVTLSREEANIRASMTGMLPYDALLDQYEPEMTQQRLDQLFLPMNQWLPELISEVQAHQKSWQRLKPGHYDAAAQKRVGLKIMEYLGFDFNHGRLDVSVHPFCGGVAEDVRITTRYESDDFSRSLMGIVHETGHARYEQNLPQQWRTLPVGQARSMGIHESQSLFFEMQLAKQPSFLQQILPWLREELVPELSLTQLCQHYLKVEPSYIRIDADEVTYPAHILLRYQIERDLISGAIEVDDIPQMWDELMQKYLGLSTAGNYRDGCMQDIHWTDGSFGYFPSYTLGAMYAAQFMASMQKTVNIENAIQGGDLTPISTWLSDNIWSKGSLLTTDELVRQATGETLNPQYFREHLRNRYLN